MRTMVFAMLAGLALAACGGDPSLPAEEETAALVACVEPVIDVSACDEFDAQGRMFVVCATPAGVPVHGCSRFGGAPRIAIHCVSACPVR